MQRTEIKNGIIRRKFAHGSKEYRSGVEFIAYNDDPAVKNIHDITQNITVHLLSAMFLIPPATIANDVLFLRDAGEYAVIKNL